MDAYLDLTLATSSDFNYLELHGIMMTLDNPAFIFDRFYMNSSATSSTCTFSWWRSRSSSQPFRFFPSILMCALVSPRQTLASNSYPCVKTGKDNKLITENNHYCEQKHRMNIKLKTQYFWLSEIKHSH